MEPTEARYAEISREMLVSQDWLVPHLNGIPHFHKPPLSYWLSAAGMAILGVNEWGARLAAALAAGFVLWCAWRIARDRGGALAPWILASSVLFFALSHQLGSDIFLAATVAGFHAAVLGARGRGSLWPYVAMGLGFMLKGPVVFVLTLGPVLLAAAWARNGSLLTWLQSWRGWILFALIALPWYVIVLVKTPGLMTYFLKHQLLERYTSTVHQRGGPIYYFIAVLLVGALPWTWAALKRLFSAAAAARRDPTDALLSSWVLLPFVFFSFSGSKLPAYILPCFPALAVLGSRWPAEARRAFWLRAAVVTFAVFLATLAAITPFDDRLSSTRSLVRILRERRQPGEHVVEYATFSAGVPFYLGETVPMLEVPRDLGFEGAEEHARAILAREDLARMVHTQGRVWVVGPKSSVFVLAYALGFRATHVAGFRDRSLLSLEPRTGTAPDSTSTKAQP